MRSRNQPRLTLIGAGPGDPDLITVKGLKKLAEADVVLYDALVNKLLLRYAPRNALKLLVGKRAGRHIMMQAEINRMIVEMARTYGHVVRLKGGDPFIFGRGYEELSFAVEHSIPCEVVPGISSSTGIPAMNNIPLTSRGLSESFWVITGTTADGQLSGDIKIAIRSTATLIILMGMKKLSQIADLYKKNGKRNMPVMVIQNGSMDEERSVAGDMTTIENKVEQAGIASPAIIIIGSVVYEAEKIRNLNHELKYLLLSRMEKVRGEFSNLNTKSDEPQQLISRFS